MQHFQYRPGDRCQISLQVVFPHPDHGPAHGLESRDLLGVPGPVAVQLVPPERDVGFRPDPMLRAAMPEAAVHEDGQSPAGERDVDPSDPRGFAWKHAQPGHTLSASPNPNAIGPGLDSAARNRLVVAPLRFLLRGTRDTLPSLARLRMVEYLSLSASRPLATTAGGTPCNSLSPYCLRHQSRRVRISLADFNFLVLRLLSLYFHNDSRLHSPCSIFFSGQNQLCSLVVHYFCCYCCCYFYCYCCCC